MTRKPSVSMPLWLLFVLLAAVPAAAQTPAGDTRAGEIAGEQQEKAQHLAPYRQHPLERRLLEIEEAGGFAAVRGWFVGLGDIKRGSGVALGPAYGKLFDSGATVVGKVGYSVRNFKLAQLYASAPPLAAGRLHINGRVRWQDAPVLAVYPGGRDSRQFRADYAESKTELSAQALLKPLSFIRLGAGVGFEAFDTDRADTERPPVEEVYSGAELPGLGTDPRYLHSFVLAGIDSRPFPGYSRSGTLLQAALHDYRQQNDGPHSFQRIDGVARQLIPILRGNWVIDLSVRTSTTTVDAGNQVPFFLLPDLGGSGELRGYPSYRFRDRNSIIFTGEYRWYVQEFVDMAVFYDAGKVVSSSKDLDFDALKSDVGVGLRFHGIGLTFFRIEVAKSNEGYRLIFGFSAPVR